MRNNWLNQDGTINTAALDEIEAALTATTDQVGGLMDRVTQKGMVPAFVCSHSGLHLPGDYVKEWGRKYGVGLGRDPVSEILDTNYDVDPPEITPQIKRIEQIMHPVGASFAQVDRVMIHPSEFDKAIMAEEDKDMEGRAVIMRANQLKNPRGRIGMIYAAWHQKRSAA